MNKSFTRALCIASIVGIVGIPLATAANPHYKKNGQPDCSISFDGDTATASCSSGTVAGLGNDNVRVSVTLSAQAGTFCHNKGNPSHIVPGQNPAIAIGSSSLDFSPDQIKNGSLTIPPISASVTLATPSPETAGCPNSNWSVTLDSPTFSSGTYSFEQPPGTVIAKLSFTFD